GFIWGRDQGYLAALGQQVGRHHLVIGPLTRIPMTHVENCADVFALAATDPRAVGQTLNVVDGPGARISSYLSDYMRGSGQPGARVRAVEDCACWVFAVGSRPFLGVPTVRPAVTMPLAVRAQKNPDLGRNPNVGKPVRGAPPRDSHKFPAGTFCRALPSGP